MNHRTKLSEEIRAAIADTIKNNPNLSYERIAELFSVSLWTIHSIAKQEGIQRPRGTAAKAYGKENS